MASTNLPIVGDTVIVIDAFDDIGAVEDRADALEVLTKQAHELLDGLCVVVTSRFEKDIQEALQSPKVMDIDYMLMENIPTDLTARDISLYVHDALGDVQDLEPTDLNRVATAAGDSFQWASTACWYVCSSDDGRGARVQGPRARLPLFLASNQGLDELYIRILEEHFGEESPEALAKLKPNFAR